MIKNKHIRASIYFLVVLSFFACTTTPLSFVKQRIVGTWIRTPLNPDEPDQLQKWVFSDDGTMILENTLPDSVSFGSGLDPTVIYEDSVDWDILWPGTKHFIQLRMKVPSSIQGAVPEEIAASDSLLEIYNQALNAKLYIEKWEIIKINKKVLQIALHSTGRDVGLQNNDLNLIGGIQITFVRE